MAETMTFDPLPYDRVVQLIEHVLYEREYDGVSGKEGWCSFESNIITEREFRNLVMANSATEIARHNKQNEPSSAEYSNKELCHSFEMALFGSVITPGAYDMLDPWEN